MADIPPIAAIYPELCAALGQHGRALLQAPTGSGKTTHLPLMVRDAPWLGDKKILILEPRRLAAKMAARYMAQKLGEEVGQQIGYRVRLENRVSNRSKIELVTDGIFTRMLQRDPTLAGYGLVIFDEFHERSLEAELGLALLRDAVDGLGLECRILVMSATLDSKNLHDKLRDWPFLAADGQSYPVAIGYLEKREQEPLAQHVLRGVREALQRDKGDILVFLPGQAEIRACQKSLAELRRDDVTIIPLYGDLSPAEQDQAMQPAPSGRKIILASAIAESSLTIPGISMVVDSGLSRRSHFDPNRGMSSLVTNASSMASATQRAGRAGRLAPGYCLRLWREQENRLRPDHDPPEIFHSDLAPLLLELKLWGVGDIYGLPWLDPPDKRQLNQAETLLQLLGALDEHHAITQLGRQISQLGLHPRLGRMLCRAAEEDALALGAVIAALLGERDPLPRERQHGANLHDRLDWLQHQQQHYIWRLADDYMRRMGGKAGQRQLIGDAGELLSWAFPDWVAQRRGSSGNYRLRSGRGAALSATDSLQGAEFLAIAALDGAGRDARIFLAAPLSQKIIEREFADAIDDSIELLVDKQSGAMQLRQRQKLGALVLRDAPAAASQQQVDWGNLWRDWLLSQENWTSYLSDGGKKLLARWRWLAAQQTDFPDPNPAYLLAGFDMMAGINQIRQPTQLLDLPWANYLLQQLDYRQQQILAENAPSHFTTPYGNNHPIDYDDTNAPLLAAKVQEFFGLQAHPLIAGQVPLTLSLLSPAGRPLQVTRDLPGFWQGSWQHVKKELKGRYPKHFWPDQPALAMPTRGTKPRG